jgi:hypothetical protein
MGWADCGTDSQGRPIGYAFEATCDQPGCDEAIDRGLSYVCGTMHGEDEFSCEKYYCEKHRSNFVSRGSKASESFPDDEREDVILICDECAKALIASGEMVEYPDGVIRDRVVCSGCNQEIDPYTCGCGDAIKGHGYDNGHGPVPLGCDCLRPKPGEE